MLEISEKVSAVLRGGDRTEDVHVVLLHGAIGWEVGNAIAKKKREGSLLLPSRPLMYRPRYL
ncbi:MAG: hypothetical protein RL518_1885 [Pseudomonadota bacterium]